MSRCNLSVFGPPRPDANIVISQIYIVFLSVRYAPFPASRVLLLAK